MEDKSKIIEDLCAHVLETRFENIDESVIEGNKNLIIDVLGCIIGGANAYGNRALVDLIRYLGGRPEATILVHGDKVPAQNAAMVNSILSRSYDFEPVACYVNGVLYPPHLAGTTVPTAISVGESRRVDGKELLTALIVGNDVALRIFCAPTNVWDIKKHLLPWASVNVFGATAIAGRLLGLNHSQLRNAFGIAISMMAGAGSGLFEGATTFKINQGTSARDGILAAELAKRGWIGIKDPLFSRFAYYDVFTPVGCDRPEFITADLGKKFYYETLIKPYPGGVPTHAPIDAALALANKHDIKFEEIEEVELLLTHISEWYLKPDVVGEDPVGWACFNYKYAVATALMRRSVDLENFAEDSILDPRIQLLLPRIKIRSFPPERPRQHVVKLVVKTKDGREFSESVVAARGHHPNPPLSREEIIQKFYAQVKFSRTVSRKNAEKLLNLVQRLEEIDDVSKIVEFTLM
ncbi:MAG: MmgE/PrpD family protein [Candidatus Bathyarchaeia archaeon]